MGYRNARRVEFDTVLTVCIGAAEREWDARVIYWAGPWQAEIERIEICEAGTWIGAPWLMDLIGDSAPLFDALRAHAGAVLTLR